MLSVFSESVVEDAAVAWLESLGYAIKHGPEVRAANFPNERTEEKLSRRLKAAVSAKNASTQKEGRMQKNAYCFESQNLVKEFCPNRGRQLVQKMHQFRVPGNHFRKGYSWALGCRRD